MKLINMDEEYRCNYYVSDKKKKVWNYQLDMLRRLLSLCKDNGLRIWVDAGTMLGAVRHHGFIPWDDDMDVCMPRCDFEILEQIAPDYFKEPFFFQSPKTDVHYARGHGQLRRSDTAAIRPSDCYRPFNQGIFIDIFPFDGLPEDDYKTRLVMKVATKRMKCLKSIDYPILWSGRIFLLGRKYRWRRKVRKEGFYNLYKPVEYVFDACPWDEAKYVAQMGVSGTRLVYNKSIFEETLWMPFESIDVPVPIGYDEYLSIRYGNDYMVPNPKAPNDHGPLVLDPDHSYKEIMPEVRRTYRHTALKRLARKLSSKTC